MPQTNIPSGLLPHTAMRSSALFLVALMALAANTATGQVGNLGIGCSGPHAALRRVDSPG